LCYFAISDAALQVGNGSSSSAAAAEAAAANLQAATVPAAPYVQKVMTQAEDGALPEYGVFKSHISNVEEFFDMVAASEMRYDAAASHWVIEATHQLSGGVDSLGKEFDPSGVDNSFEGKDGVVSIFVELKDADGSGRVAMCLTGRCTAASGGTCQMCAPWRSRCCMCWRATCCGSSGPEQGVRRHLGRRCKPCGLS
jgi:hypothetical protein